MFARNMMDSKKTKAKEGLARRTAGASLMADIQRAKNLEKARQVNEMTLATQFPQQYAELQAGQKLAPGDVVIGGQPNRRMIESAVDAMMR
jgi:hypothetical protein